MISIHTMRAAQVDEPKASFNIVTVASPVPDPGEVLVRISASGVNPLDTKIRAGTAAHARQALPAILGIDMAGTVIAVGADAGDFRVGDEVYGAAGGVGGLQGTLAELAAVDHRLIARKPRNLSMREAAALPLALITAWEGLVDRAAVSAGQKVLIHGGAGGVGHVAVQLAKALGAEVYSTVSADHFEIITGYGARPIDFRAKSVEQYVDEFTAGDGFDVVYDTVGGSTLDASFLAARRYGGHVVSILGWGTHSLAPLSFRAATYSGVFTLLPMTTGRGRERHGEILREAATLVESGQLLPLLDRHEFTLDNTLDAHRLVESGQARGKVVVTVEAKG
jgi:NADPH2:quinone reductase